jgi:pSer/pThr/pTyr-binding forkhead associated (FHA) protein
VRPVRAWLVQKSGARSGSHFALREGITRVGRSPQNDVVVDGPDAATVSQQHVEIHANAQGFRVLDLGSTNGTYLNGAAVAESPVKPPAVIRLGSTGPLFALLLEREEPAAADRTVISPRPEEVEPETPAPSRAAAGDRPASTEGTFDTLLSDAVRRARQARSSGRPANSTFAGNQTLMIMREALFRALDTSRRKARRIIALLTIVLLVVTTSAAWKIWDLRRTSRAIDTRLQELEQRLQQASGDPSADVDKLIAELDSYQGEARQLRAHLLFGLLGSGPQDPIEREIRTLMAEFGAEVYSVPPEFTRQVKHHLTRYQGPERPHMQHALGEGQRHLSMVKQILESQHLPQDLAYIPIVESALRGNSQSPAGAAGPWQFTPSTARGYGLRVEGGVDERQDWRKSTLAACRYLRELILDFGAGSSIMLALAAYNL